MRTVIRFWEPAEAYIFRGRLAAEGIQAFAADDHTVAVDWFYAIAIGGVRVQVSTDDVERAKDVYARCVEGDYTKLLTEEFGDLEDRLCPHCGSRDLRSDMPLWTILAGLALMPILGASRFRTREVLCRTCGERWNDDR